MISLRRLSIAALTGIILAGSALAQDPQIRRDSQGIEVIKNMVEHIDSLDHLAINSISVTGARMDAGLMVENSVESRLIVDRPGSIYITSFDGENILEIYFHKGIVTVSGSEQNYYARTKLPESMQDSVKFAMEELEVEAPLLELFYLDVFNHLIESQDEIHYLTGNALVSGAKCHQVAVRGTDTDMQMWVQQGDQPLLRKISMTSKWESGSPRYTAILNWEENPEFDADAFEFTAPEGATDIGFANVDSGEGE